MLSVLTSCNRADDIIEALSESDAVEIITTNIQANAGGLTSNLQDAAAQFAVALTSGELCDSLYMKSIDKDYQGARFQSDYTGMLSYEMTCNMLDVPQSASFAYQSTVMYNSPNVTSNDTRAFTGTASGLQPAATSISVNGEYISTGTQTIHARSQQNVSSSLTINVSSIQFNKQQTIVDSGNATFELTGNTPDGQFEYDGSIVFHGSGMATITIEGTSYDVSWR